MHSYTPRMGVEFHISKALAANGLADEIAKIWEKTKTILKRLRIV